MAGPRLPPAGILPSYTLAHENQARTIPKINNTIRVAVGIFRFCSGRFKFAVPKFIVELLRLIPFVQQTAVGWQFGHRPRGNMQQPLTQHIGPEQVPFFGPQFLGELFLQMGRLRGDKEFVNQRTFVGRETTRDPRRSRIKERRFIVSLEVDAVGSWPEIPKARPT